MRRTVRGITVALAMFAVGSAEMPPPAPQLPMSPDKEGVREQSGNIIALANAFIRIRVNAGATETARFAVETTGGDPVRPEDDGKVLLYGHPVPWTSFTTLQINGKNYAFGGQTLKRAGYGLPVGRVALPPQISEEEGAISTAYAFPEDIFVKQDLSLAASPTTGYLDSALIEYTVSNLGNAEQQVGVRVMLDTMLGSNDGAPLRVGGLAVSAEKCVEGEGVPDFIQAFDSLEAPTVVSQGTFRGQDLTPPDALVIANWGSLADAPWGFECREGASLIREGEDEPDSAVALYWMPRSVAPGESFTIRFLYGLGGLTLGEGKLLLGLTTPLEIPYRRDATSTVMVLGFVENEGGVTSTNTRLVLRAPLGVAVVAGNTEVNLGDLQPGESRQYAWRIQADGRAFGEAVLRMEARSETYDTNAVTRSILITGLKKLDAVLIAPERLQAEDRVLSPNPFRVTLRLHNPNDDSVGRLHFALTLPEGLHIKPPESLTKSVSGLKPKENREIHWLVFADDGAGSVNLTAKAEAEDSYPVFASSAVFVPALSPRIRITTHPAEPTEGEYFFVTAYLMNTPEVARGEFEFVYDPTVVKYVRYSQGTLSLRAGHSLKVKKGPRDGIIKVSFEVTPGAIHPEQESLFMLHFKGLRPRDSGVAVTRWEIQAQDGVRYVPLFFKAITVK
ncbi:MAG: hypothetical protein V2G50_07550 [bacterium JZ-2024 1]